MSGQIYDKTKMFSGVRWWKGEENYHLTLFLYVIGIIRYFIKFLFVKEYNIDGIEMKNDQIIDMF